MGTSRNCPATGIGMATKAMTESHRSVLMDPFRP